MGQPVEPPMTSGAAGAYDGSGGSGGTGVAGVAGSSDDWRYQPCPPCCVPPAPCPPTCSDFHLTTTEYYPSDSATASCRWDNATCYNEGNDQSGNFIKQWNRHCHFTTYQDGVGGQSGGQRDNLGQDTGVFGTTYPRKPTRGCPRSDIRAEVVPGGRTLISGPPIRDCHRKVEKVYSKPMKSETQQSSMNSQIHGSQKAVTTHPTKSPKSAITAALIDPAMLNRGNQLWWNQRNDNPNQRNNSQRVAITRNNSSVSDRKLDAQHHRKNVEMPLLFFRKPKDDKTSSV